MRGSLATSTVLHAALLAVGLVTFSAPRQMQVAEVESLPVDIVPVEQFATTMKGDKKAPKAERSAPKPTTKPDTVKDATEIGDNTADLKTPPTPESKPREVKTAAVPESKPVEEPKKPEEDSVAKAIAEAEKKAEQAAKAAQAKAAQDKADAEKKAAEALQKAEDAKKAEADAKAKAEAEAKAEADAKAKAEAEAKAEADAKAKAKAEAKAKADKAAREAAAKKLEDEVLAALQTTEKASGGGAKRSQDKAALGGKQTTGAKLTASELGALSDQLAGCWSLPVGAEDGDGLRVDVGFNVDTSGKVDGAPHILKSSGNRQFDESALRAVRKCDAQGLLLPEGKSETWAEVIVHFDPAEMF